MVDSFRLRFDHAAMSAMRNAIPHFDRIIGSNFVFCKCHFLSIRRYPQQMPIARAFERQKTFPYVAVAECPLCGIQFRKLDFMKMEALPCNARSRIGPRTRTQLRRSNGY
ncbi:hypothetical protein [Stutzerimonas nitrititolerans]|uniref:hypothetical protein n=1 Tax=Stutzerimonas nitrititolerans TaxID=2482751 RepID=UPI0035E41905